MTTESEKLEKIKLDRLEARRAKLEHQDREDRATQEQINKQGKRQKESERVTPKATIQTFQALNEKENKSAQEQKELSAPINYAHVNRARA